MKKSREIKWLNEPAEKDYPAAETYLRLYFNEKKTRSLTKKLRHAPISKFAARDILRASGIPMAEVSAFDWILQRNEVKDGEPISPLLLVRRGDGGDLIVADGFHRLCAVFAFNQEALVLCKII